MQKVFNKIDDLFEEYLFVWEEVCNIESPTNYKKGVDEVGEYFKKKAEKLGFKVEVFPQEVSGNVYQITMNENSKNVPITISGHMDTVHAIGSFGNPPVKIDNGKIYGPGVMDCKGGCVVGLMVMHALKECGYMDRPVLFFLQSDEENSSVTSNKATIYGICERAKGSVAFLNLEGYESYFKNYGCIERKGIITYKFIVKGDEAHASLCAEKGANAIAEASHKILEIEKMKDGDGITCNVGVISGGKVPNTVAGECSFKVDVRFNNEEQEKFVHEKFREIASATYIQGCKTELELINVRIAMPLVDRNVDLLNKINKIYAENGFDILKIGKRKGGSDAAYATSYGIPCVDSLGIQGEYAHSTKEEAEISSLTDSAKKIASLIVNL